MSRSHGVYFGIAIRISPWILCRSLHPFLIRIGTKRSAGCLKAPEIARTGSGRDSHERLRALPEPFGRVRNPSAGRGGPTPLTLLRATGRRGGAAPAEPGRLRCGGAEVSGVQGPASLAGPATGGQPRRRSAERRRRLLRTSSSRCSPPPFFGRSPSAVSGRGRGRFATSCASARGPLRGCSAVIDQLLRSARLGVQVRCLLRVTRC